MSSGPDDRSTATIKYGKDYADPWFVASGNPAAIRRQLLEFAGLEDDPGKSLQELILDVATETQAMWAARSKAGGRRISKDGTAAAPERESVAQPAQSAEEPEGDDDVARIKEAIAEAKDVPALRMVFAKDKEKFSTNPELQAAFKDRKAQLDKEGN